MSSSHRRLACAGLACLFAVACSKADARTVAPSTPATPSTPPRALIAPAHPSPLGINLAELRDYGSERPFVDAFKQSRAWISSSGETWDDGQPIDVDAHGNVKALKPGQKARALVWWGDDLQFPAGDFLVTWKGTGTLEFWPQSDTPIASTGSGSFLLSADPKRGGIAVTIAATNPADPVRDLHVWIPGAHDGKAPTTTTLVSPAFLARLQAFSVLRFMDWMETNNSTIVTPAERPLPDDARYTVKGVPAEVIADVANAANADAWVCIGHTWNDALVEQFATVLRDRLDGRHRIYVEHSNEIWNGVFPQADAMRTQGVARGLSQDAFEAQLRMHAERSLAVHAIFDRVFGAQKNRVVRVLGGWAANAWSSDVMLRQVETHGVPSSLVDAVAIAPYFGGSLGEPEQQARVATMDVPALMKALDGSVNESLGWVRDHQSILGKAGVPLIAYEGGQHLVGVGPVLDDEKVNALFDAANRDPQMKVLYLRMLQGWKAAGGRLFVAYNSTQLPSKWGRWGAVRTMDEPRAAAPKYDALLGFVEGTPRWW